jgi:hydroxyacylglutathione hydrolase
MDHLGRDTERGLILLDLSREKPFIPPFSIYYYNDEVIDLFLEKLKSSGLAHLSYFIGSRGEAAVIDPRRDSEIYMRIAEREEMTIRYILETHRNEDYVSGSMELASYCGAKILHGEHGTFEFGEPVSDNQTFPLGNLVIEGMHTPGHTLGHMSYLVRDPRLDNEPLILFSGDSLFVGDTGRTDFYGKENDEKMAGMMHHSIFERILPLGDGVILAPAHGAGSVCGGNISAREISTIGTERRTNPALQLDRVEFIRMKVNEDHVNPAYFKTMEHLNTIGASLIRDIREPTALPPDEFLEAMDDGGLVIDTRSPPSFAGAYIKGSYSMWREGIPSFAGCILPYDRSLLLVLEENTDLDRVVKYLHRMGYDNIAGYLREGIENWIEMAYPTEHLGLLTVDELSGIYDSGDITVLDVRSKGDFRGGHVPGAANIYCAELEGRVDELPLDKPIAIICSSGYRSTLAASVIRMQGCQDARIVLGGTKAWEAADYPIDVED